MYKKHLLALGATGLLLTGFTAIDVYPENTVNNSNVQTLDREQSYEYELQSQKERIHVISDTKEASVPQDLLDELEAPNI